MADEERSALEQANEQERALQLGGPDYKLADGRTVAETLAALLEEHTKEGAETAATQLKRVREQSIEGDPLYAKDSKVVVNEAGGATVVEAAAKPEAKGEQARIPNVRASAPPAAHNNPAHVLDPGQ